MFTKYFPYTRYEVFIENEVEIFSRHFSDILVFNRVTDEFKRELPSNVKLNSTFASTTLPPLKISEWFFCLKIHLKSLTEDRFLNRMVDSMKDFKFLIRKFKEAKKMCDIIEERQLSGYIFYSVWMNDWALVLALLKKQKKISDFYCRAHGYDMYHFRYKSSYVPYRKFILENVKSVSCVSSAGRNYLVDRFPALKSKFKLAHLGVFDRGINKPSSDMVFVSASNVNPVKRLHLMVDALREIRLECTWIHFGDGPLLDTIKASCVNLNPLVKIEFRGRVSSKELTEFYNNTPVSALVLLSESEGGVPVAIQEAVSFGIPVIATMVGGVAEILTKNNGIALDKDFETSLLTGILENFAMNRLNDPESRSVIKEEWKNKFDAEINFNTFIHHLNEAEKTN